MLEFLDYEQKFLKFNRGSYVKKNMKALMHKACNLHYPKQ